LRDLFLAEAAPTSFRYDNAVGVALVNAAHENLAAPSSFAGSTEAFLTRHVV
jgi:hypothetical protein